jgi:hypothetical protein
MLRGLKELKYHKFENYLRQCRDCCSIFKTNVQRGRYCEKCLVKRKKIRIEKSLIGRGIKLKIQLKIIKPTAKLKIIKITDGKNGNSN